MKTVQEVQARLRALLVMELSLRLEEAQRRLPTSCVYNHRQVLDVRREVQGEPNAGFNRIDRQGLPVLNEVGLCMFGAESLTEWPGNICDEVVDAQRCPMFQSVHTKEKVFSEFKAQLQDADWLKSNLPEVASLLWVLGDTLANHHLPWWLRLWYWVLRFRVEPVCPRRLEDYVQE